jgi:hypothetical protein
MADLVERIETEVRAARVRAARVVNVDVDRPPTGE